MSDLWVKKNIEQLREECVDAERGLRRALGPVALISLGIGAIVGAGIFVISGGLISWALSTRSIFTDS